MRELFKTRLLGALSSLLLESTSTSHIHFYSILFPGSLMKVMEDKERRAEMEFYPMCRVPPAFNSRAFYCFLTSPPLRPPCPLPPPHFSCSFFFFFFLSYFFFFFSSFSFFLFFFLLLLVFFFVFFFILSSFFFSSSSSSSFFLFFFNSISISMC